MLPSFRNRMTAARRRRVRIGIVCAVLICGAVSSSAPAQTSGCTTTTLADPPREVLRCGNGLSITAERGSAYRLEDRNRDGRPDAATLESRGLLVQSPPKRGMFQILTPHAIATVRGTVWAVDVSPARSSVFVGEGAVEVRRRHGDETVTLRAGDGVDVDDTTALEVKRWSAERAARLLARFGR